MAVSVTEFERNYVHEVYDMLSKHSDGAKSRKWPLVENFVRSFDVGSIILDLGCGEGQYMQFGNLCHMVGLEMCSGYSQMVHERGCSAVNCDITNIPLRSGSCDGVICVAVIHHLVTVERRIAALRELSRVMARGGRALITVWALENPYRKFSGQDVLVPIRFEDGVAFEESIPKPETGQGQKTSNVLPSFSIFPKIESFCSSLFSELDSLKTKFTERVSTSFSHTLRDKRKQFTQWFDENFPLFGFRHPDQKGRRFTMRRTQSEYQIASKRCALTHNDSQSQQACESQNRIPTKTHSNSVGRSITKVRSKSVGASMSDNDFHRYYHVFQEGELGSLMMHNVPSLFVTAEYHQAGNWVVEVIKVK